MFFDSTEDIRISGDQVAFGRYCYAKSKGIQKLQRVPGQFKLPFIRVIRVAHRAGPHHAGYTPAAQLVPYDPQRVLLCTHLIKRINPITFAAAVTVDTTMTASFIKIHIKRRSEPG